MHTRPRPLFLLARLLADGQADGLHGGRGGWEQCHALQLHVPDAAYDSTSAIHCRKCCWGEEHAEPSNIELSAHIQARVRLCHTRECEQERG